MDVAEFVQQQEIETAVAADDAGQDAFVGGLDEFVDQLGGGDVADAPSLFTGGQPKADQQVRLAPVPESRSRTTGSPASR